MKKLILATALVTSPALVCAETIQWSGDLAATCTFSSVVAGTLTVTDTGFTTFTIASYVIDNNEAGSFAVTFPAITSFASAPGTAAMTSAAAQTITPSGANTGTPSGDNGTGYSLTLTSSGSTTFNHDITGSITNGVPGTYAVESAVVCVSV